MTVFSQLLSLFTKKKLIKCEQEVRAAALDLALEWDQYLLLEEEVGFRHQRLIDFQTNNTNRYQGGNVTLSNLTRELSLAVTRMKGEVISLDRHYSKYLSTKHEYQKAGGSILVDFLAEAWEVSSYSEAAMKNMVQLIESFRKECETTSISEVQQTVQEVPSVNLGVV